VHFKSCRSAETIILYVKYSLIVKKGEATNIQVNGTNISGNRLTYATAFDYFHLSSLYKSTQT